MFSNMNENNVDIFIGTYKDFTPKVTNNAYKIIYGKHDISMSSSLPLIKCVSPDSILDDRFFSEIYMLRNLPCYAISHDYIGFCHYRKYFNFLDNIPNLKEIFQEYDVILGNPLIFKCDVYHQYGKAHNSEDLDIVGDIIKKNALEYNDAWNEVMQGNILYPYNMFIQKTSMFYEYIKFVVTILNKYIEIVGIDIIKHIKENTDKYLKQNYPNSTIAYQYRIGGYLAERLTNVFFKHKCEKIKTYPILITDKKYIAHDAATIKQTINSSK